MKKFTKLWALLLAAAMILCIVSGCSKVGPAATEPTDEAAAFLSAEPFFEDDIRPLIRA